MSEPPKPITRLAQPIDRHAPRRRNALGHAAGHLCGWTWLVGMVLAMFTPMMVMGDEPWVSAAGLWSWRIFYFVAPLAGLTSILLAIVALVRAAERHLAVAAAVNAIIWSAGGLAFWGWLAVPTFGYLFQ